jgi:hypothetical protein
VAGAAACGGSVVVSEQATSTARTVPEDVKRFFAAVFEARDIVGVRPIETWRDEKTGRQERRALWKAIHYARADWRSTDGQHRDWLLRVAERNRANLFFMVAPRFGPKSENDKRRWDLSWQIRTVRTLWADVDHCSVDDALKRCEAAGVPRPTATINSGNGAHLYWRLTEPYLIDDVDDPPGVGTKWIEQGPDRKNAHRSVLHLAPKNLTYLYLLDRKTGNDSGTLNPECSWGKLSPKALYIQDVLAGIASKIGGDHTSDLARSLRLPCTLNRKDERNGKTPVPCVLVDCDPARRYAVADFEGFAGDSPARARREAVAKIRLPRVRKLAANKVDRLDNLVNACAVAECGTRSERDWNLLCWAIEHGVDPEDLWRQVQGVGKFAEGGRRYFDATWANAQGHTQLKIYHRLERKQAARSATRSSNGSGKNGQSAHASNGHAAGNGTAEPPPTDPPPAGELGPERYEPEPSCVNESLTDPHRLARCWQLWCATSERPDGKVVVGDRVAYYRQNHWMWKGTHWRIVPDHEMVAILTRFAKRDLEMSFASEIGRAKQTTTKRPQCLR